MNKINLTKTYKTYFSAGTKPEIVHIEEASYISIRGMGDPNGEDFAQRIEALYSTAYTIKFNFKAINKDFVVSKLEALWWYDMEKFKGRSIQESPTNVPRSQWEYRLLLRMPEFVRKSDVPEAVEKVFAKKNIALAREVEFYTLNEGKCVQILHVGPFSTEPESLDKIANFVNEHNLLRNGHHHEIYLSDFRKTDSAKLRTILREPVK